MSELALSNSSSGFSGSGLVAEVLLVAERKSMDTLRLFDLTGKTALVTGSTRGLGRALARGLASAGAAVVLNGRHPDALEEAAAAFRSDGLTAHTSCFDVTDEATVEAAVARIEQEVGPIDILVNNAGIILRGAFPDHDTETWRRVLDVNLTGAMYVARSVARRMVARRRGKIINICSLQSERVRVTCGAYAVSKTGLKALTKALAVDLGPYNIQVNGIGPGYFATELTRDLREDPEFDRWVRSKTPAARWGEPQELIGPAVFLASDASSFVNGQVIYVDGGWLAAM